MASDPMAQDIIRCDLCSKGTFTGITPAEVVCKTCNIYLCQVCMAKHVSSQLSVKHDILRIRYHRPDFNCSLPFCHIHPKIKCELNCQDCNIPVCSKCIAGPHKKHNFVEISKIFNSKKQIMEQDNEELKNIILPTYERINSEYEDKISIVPRGYSNFKKEITKQGEEWHKIVDIVIRKHLKKAEEMETADVAKLRRNQSEIRKVQKSAQDVFHANKTSLQSNDTNKVINYKSRNAELKKVPAKTELSPPSFSRGEISEDLSVCVPDTEQLYVTGSNSSTINHLDHEGKLLNQITTKSGNNTGINLSVMRDGRLVYSDHDDRSVNIVNSNKIETVIILQGWYPSAVCCTSTNDLLVIMMSANGNSKVGRYAGSTVTQEIQFDDQGKALYSDPKFIVENGNLDICVTDWRIEVAGGSVVVVDKAGKLKFTYDGEHKMRMSGEFYPQGLATDNQCHVLVTDWNNNCVHILNHDGSFIRYIDNCNLDHPTDLSISSENVLYVVDDTRKVKVIRNLQ